LLNIQTDFVEWWASRLLGNSGMGINFVCWRARLLAGVLGLTVAAAAMFASVHSTAKAQSRDRSAKLLIERVAQLIAEKSASSSFFQVQKKLHPTDFGQPLMDWRRPGALNPNSSSILFRDLVLHAVCVKNSVALAALNAANSTIYGGLFDEREAEYLDWLASTMQLNATFRNIFRDRRHGSLDDDLSAINARRTLQRAISEGREARAKRLIASFAALCDPSDR